MQLFYDPAIQTGPYELREEEAHHAARVLRRSVGDVLDIVDGRGGRYRAEITEITKKYCRVDAVLEMRETIRKPYQSWLAVAPTKTNERYEWWLEKATEIGIDRITPLLCEHSERKQIRHDRYERILEAGMKQSLAAWMPKLDELTIFDDLLGSLDEPGGARIAWVGGTASEAHLADTVERGEDVLILIGPEGGFSPAEVAAARERGIRAVHLGDKRLRTETAALAALHTLVLLNR